MNADQPGVHHCHSDACETYVDVDLTRCYCDCICCGGLNGYCRECVEGFEERDRQMLAQVPEGDNEHS